MSKFLFRNENLKLYKILLDHNPVWEECYPSENILCSSEIGSPSFKVMATATVFQDSELLWVIFADMLLLLRHVENQLFIRLVSACPCTDFAGNWGVVWRTWLADPGCIL